MNGKIFPDSANIWQDQAKVLFNYYRQAAERIVSEEERIEGQIAALNQEKNELEIKLSKVWVWLFLFIFPYFIKKKSLEQQIESVDQRIDEFNKMYTEIFRDYKVSRFGVAYVPVADQIKYQDKSFIVDYTSSVPESEVSMSTSRQNDLLIDMVKNLENLTENAPIVETSEDSETIQTDDYSLSIQQVTENDYLGALERSLRTLAFCMDDLDTTSIQLPVVTDDSKYLHELEEYATTTPLPNAPVVNVFDAEALKPGIKKFEEINDLKNVLSNETQRFEEVLRNLMESIGQSVQTVARLKVESVDKVVMDSNRLLYQILKAPYNHYSPLLEAEEIERIRKEKFDYSESVQGYEPFVLKQSSRVRFNPLSGNWVAEDGSQTVKPFGVHQMYEEIVAPVVENLMQENRVERLRIYNNIKDQKLSYLNKWHQDTDNFYIANRAESADLINLMQQTLTEYVAAYNNLLALQRTENQMAESGQQLDATVVETVNNDDETVAAFELQSQEFQKCQVEFEEFINRLKEDIDLKAEMFGHIEYYDAKLRDGYSNSVAVAASEVQDLDERRKALALVNPKLAKDSDLLPEPHVSDVTYEHFSINLPGMVREAMSALNSPDESMMSQAETNQVDYSEMPTVEQQVARDENEILNSAAVDAIEPEFKSEGEEAPAETSEEKTPETSENAETDVKDSHDSDESEEEEYFEDDEEVYDEDEGDEEESTEEEEDEEYFEDDESEDENEEESKEK